MRTMTIGSFVVLVAGATLSLFDTVDAFWMVLALLGIGSAWFVYCLGRLGQCVGEGIAGAVQRRLAPCEPADATGADGPEDAPVGIRSAFLGG